MRQYFRLGFFTMLMVVGITQAQGQPRDMSPPDFSKMPFMEELNLSEAQREKIKALHESNRPQFEKDREAMHQAKTRFDEAMDGDGSPDEIRKRFHALQKARDAMMSFGFEQALAVREILTPEQRKKFQEVRRDKFRGRMHHHRPEGPMGPGPDGFGPSPP